MKTGARNSLSTARSRGVVLIGFSCDRLYEGSVKWQLPSLVITDDICLWVNEGVKEEKNAHGKRGVTQGQW